MPKKYSANLNVVEGNLSGGSPVIQLTPQPHKCLKLPQFKSHALFFGSFELGNTEAATICFAIDNVDGVERVYIDLNQNNDLTDDGVFGWIQELKEDGTPASEPKLNLKVSYSVIENGVTKRISTSLVLRRHNPTELLKHSTSEYQTEAVKKGPGQSVLLHLDTHREGKVTIESEEYRVALVDCGMNGLYNKRHDMFLIDLDQDGEFDLSPDSLDRFSIKDPININGITYRIIKVTPSGGYVELQETDEILPDRDSLERGYPVPTFSGEGISGEPFSLSTFRGKIVLLYFWSPDCKPCEIELPYLKEAYAKYESAGLEIIGISSSRYAESVKAYIAQNQVLWPQMLDREFPNGAIFETFRVHGIPKIFLIDQDRVIVEKEIRGERIERAVNELL